MKIHYLSLFFFLWAFNGQSYELYDLFPTPYGRSMGGAVTAVVDDSNSLNYNPAGLASISEWELRMPELIHGYGSPAILAVASKIGGLGGGEGGAAGITSSLSELDGVGASGGLEVLGFGWYRRNMGIHINLLTAQAALRVRTPSLLFSKIRARVTADSGLSMGYARSFLENKVRLGFVGRPFLVRGGFEKEYQGVEITQLSDAVSLLGVGWGYDGDLGVQGNLDPISIIGFDLKLMAGAVMQNILGTDFGNRLTSSVANVPPPLQRRYNVGVGASVMNLGKFKPTVTFELRDLGVPTTSFLEKISSGIEFKFSPKSWFHSILRGHFYKGNLGGGIAGRLWFGELELGTYAVNLGRGVGVGVDRRLYGQLSAVF